MDVPWLSWQKSVLNVHTATFAAQAQQWRIFEKIGEGSYGEVYKAREKATGKIVALKKTKLHEDEEGVPSTAIREISILRMLSRDPHTVKLMDVRQCISKDGKALLCLVFEYMETDLQKFICSYRQNIPPKVVQMLMYQLCKGVYFCHAHGVLHRDLKPPESFDGQKDNEA